MGSFWYDEVGTNVWAIDSTMWIVLTCWCNKVAWTDGIMLFNYIHIFTSRNNCVLYTYFTVYK